MFKEKKIYLSLPCNVEAPVALTFSFERNSKKKDEIVQEKIISFRKKEGRILYLSIMCCGELCCTKVIYYKVNVVCYSILVVN